MQEQHQHQNQQQQTFPFKLYNMLEYACDSEFSSSVSWTADGSAFIVHDKDVMMDNLAPMFFNQTKFRSFVSDLQFDRSKLFISSDVIMLCIGLSLTYQFMYTLFFHQPLDTAAKHLGLCAHRHT
jgi:hypothetical protein